MTEWFFIKEGKDPARYIRFAAIASFQFFPEGEQRAYLELCLLSGEKLTVFAEAESYYKMMLSRLEGEGSRNGFDHE